MNLKKSSVLAIMFAALSSSAFAQLPASRVLTLDLAQEIAREALAKCRADGHHITVLVVDALNSPKILLRDDGAYAASVPVAEMKTRAVMLYDRPSGPRDPLPAGVPLPPATIPGTINSYGGLPIKFGDVTIGAVAVGGAQGRDGDLNCAKAALAKVTNKLK